MSALVLDDVKVHFGGVRALDGVSFSVEQGELCGVVGPNGSGKTTMINAISRVTKITSGEVTFQGAPISKLNPYRLSRVGVARTFQGIRLVPDLTAHENIMVAAEQKDRRTGSAGERRAPSVIVDELMERFALDPIRDELPGALSYGTQRRVEIVRALATEPQLLLLDEPVAGMNHAERDEITQILRELHDDGLTMLIIEHDLRMLLSISDRLVVLNFGKLLAEGEPQATAKLPEVQRAYLGGDRG
ncbi:branched-chain amino acid ABC transporter ATP-binding protein [Microbacterium sp. CH12i]|uniref:ABC transporter ATP-binding protein n=1 Tax=Microbacterium sp. CH12i TaxID=1479651 RepID=UPI000461611F|nr:ABC transporter ATP-binding protein [Microbacterium sp. CH12i]KDA06735.1 branched-chain amino acid ABC transporter ATP-binding protein [Microbacterium sp. CH12i]